MNSPTWTNTSASFTSVYTSAQNGSAYSIDASGDIYFYDYSTSSWNWVSGPSTNPVVSISASVDGSISVVDNTGEAYVFTYGAWSTASTSAINIASADADHYLLVTSSGAIVKYAFGSGTTLTSSGGPSSRISTTANFGQIYGVDGSGNVYLRNGTVWASLSGKTLKQVDVSLSTTSTVQICGVDSSGSGWMYNGSTWATVSKPSGVTQFTSLEAGAGFIWATASSGDVFYGTF